MRKVKYFPKHVGEPEKSRFFTGVVIGTVICLPFWLLVAWIIFG